MNSGSHNQKKDQPNAGSNPQYRALRAAKQFGTQIHVVQPNQSIYGISQFYGVPAKQIISANQLSSPDSLVIGQALVIPGGRRYVTVRSGDTLYKIALREKVSVNELARVNGMNPNNQLAVGRRLLIPKKPEPTIEANAYLEPIGTVTSKQLESVAETAPYLTYLATFSFRINRDGTLSPPDLTNFRSIAKQNNAINMMVVTNLEKDQFSAELGSIILNNERLSDKLLTNIITTAKQFGYNDIHFDMEFLKPADREAYNRFLRKAAKRIRGAGFLISTALAPKTSATQKGEWYEAHDYKAHGQIVDFVVLMTYEWGYSAGPPMPVSPIGPVRKVITYALTEMPASKIMMGQNLYGYDWTLPYKPGGKYARAVSPQAAIALARKEHVPIQYDSKAEAPFFKYTDDAGKEHIVWFEDARSIQAKIDLIKELKLRGISYWKLGLSYPQNWLLLEGNFRIKKR